MHTTDQVYETEVVMTRSSKISLNLVRTNRSKRFFFKYQSLMVEKKQPPNFF